MYKYLSYLIKRTTVLPPGYAFNPEKQHMLGGLFCTFGDMRVRSTNGTLVSATVFGFD